MCNHYLNSRQRMTARPRLHAGRVLLEALVPMLQLGLLNSLTYDGRRSVYTPFSLHRPG